MELVRYYISFQEQYGGKVPHVKLWNHQSSYVNSPWNMWVKNRFNYREHIMNLQCLDHHLSHGLERERERERSALYHRSVEIQSWGKLYVVHCLVFHCMYIIVMP